MVSSIICDTSWQSLWRMVLRSIAMRSLYRAMAPKNEHPDSVLLTLFDFSYISAILSWTEVKGEGAEGISTSQMLALLTKGASVSPPDFHDYRLRMSMASVGTASRTCAISLGLPGKRWGMWSSSPPTPLPSSRRAALQGTRCTREPFSHLIVLRVLCCSCS